ncbi:Hypothetical predicted protein [Scomber scombrus]|uniref:Uncharacterized protein n=1 Tax=Scomber scombrus TaxID=13677 RepID=A0AAV1PPD4_SCOSC
MNPPHEQIFPESTVLYSDEKKTPEDLNGKHKAMDSARTMREHHISFTLLQDPQEPKNENTDEQQPKDDETPVDEEENQLQKKKQLRAAGVQHGDKQAAVYFAPTEVQRLAMALYCVVESHGLVILKTK